MNVDQMKQAAARMALDYLEEDTVIGIGTGSTVNHFIELLAAYKNRIAGAVASSIASEILLKKHGLRVLELNACGEIPLYVDGADESDKRLNLIKGGGGALTREKILANASTTFVCIADASKLVDILGRFPLPIEVIPMARSYVARQLVKLGGSPVLRENFISDNGNIILDVHNLNITEPIKLEQHINNIPGVVTAGIFAMRPADILILGSTDGTMILQH